MGGEAIIIRQNRAIRAFRKAGALSFDTATTMESAGVRRSLAVRRLVSLGVLVEASGGKYYLDIDAEQRLYRRRRIIIGVFVILAAIGVLFFSFREE